MLTINQGKGSLLNVLWYAFLNAQADRLAEEQRAEMRERGQFRGQLHNCRHGKHCLDVINH